MMTTEKTPPPAGRLARVDELADLLADRVRGALPDPPAGVAVEVVPADIPDADPDALPPRTMRVWVTWESYTPPGVGGRSFLFVLHAVERHPSGVTPPPAWRRERSAWFDGLAGRLAGSKARVGGCGLGVGEEVALAKDELPHGLFWCSLAVELSEGV